MKQPKRLALFFSLNFAFWCLLAVLYGIGGAQNPRILHLVLLFGICSSFVIDLDGLNGRYALLAIFLLIYFLYYGVQDLTDLGVGRSAPSADGILSESEALILTGGVLLVLSYRAALGLMLRAAPLKRFAADWSAHTTLIVGASLWLIGTEAIYVWYVDVVKNTTVESIKAGVASLSQLKTSYYIFAQMLQPVGILLLAYTWRAKRSTALLVLILAMIALQLVLGFIVDIKGLAMAGGFLVILTIVLVEGRIPKLWLLGALCFVYIAFPVYQAYRAEIVGNRGIARTQVATNIGKSLDIALSAKDRVNSGEARAQTFLERLSLKASVEMIVNGTAAGVPFQHGYTLTPILSTFLPRIVWSDKPDVPTGRLVNKLFHLSDVEDTYISPSHLGELYWNFGWPGVIVGMSLIGAICGAIGRFNLREARTVTRLLVLALTIQLVVHGFEGSIASSYVVWLRSLAAVGLLHLLFARRRVAASASTVLATVVAADVDASKSPTEQIRTDSFPHLLR
jgi:hypothetical protein